MFSIICCRRKEFQSRTVWVGQECLQKFPPNVIKNTKYNIITFLPLVSKLFNHDKLFTVLCDFQNKSKIWIYDTISILGTIQPIQILFECIFLDTSNYAILPASSSGLFIHLLVASCICHWRWPNKRGRWGLDQVCKIVRVRVSIRML